MGKKWEGELKKVLKLSESDAKNFEDRTSYYENVISAANAFTSGYAKSATKLGKSLSTLMETAEVCGRAAAELSVYEDDYENAKSSNDTAEMKRIESKMKPLVDTFENGKKENRSAAQDGNKESQEIEKLLDGLRAAIG